MFQQNLVFGTVLYKKKLCRETHNKSSWAVFNVFFSLTPMQCYGISMISFLYFYLHSLIFQKQLCRPDSKVQGHFSALTGQ